MDYHFDLKEDIKLIILTVINDFNLPVPAAMIVDTVLTHSFAEYIDIMQYLHDLTEARMVTYYIEKGVRYYSLTQKGKDAVEYFSSKIPHTVRQRLFDTSKQKAKEFLNARSIQSEYYKENDFEYAVVLKIVELQSDLFSLKLTVGSESIAKEMCGRFQKDPQSFYTSVFSMLLNDDCEI